MKEIAEALTRYQKIGSQLKLSPSLKKAVGARLDITGQ